MKTSTLFFCAFLFFLTLGNAFRGQSQNASYQQQLYQQQQAQRAYQQQLEQQSEAQLAREQQQFEENQARMKADQAARDQQAQIRRQEAAKVAAENRQRSNEIQDKMSQQTADTQEKLRQQFRENEQQRRADAETAYQHQKDALDRQDRLDEQAKQDAAMSNSTHSQDDAPVPSSVSLEHHHRRPTSSQYDVPPPSSVSLEHHRSPTLSEAEGEINRVWQQLSKEQRDSLRQSERDWIVYKDSIPEDDSARVREIQQRTVYLRRFLSQ